MIKSKCRLTGNSSVDFPRNIGYIFFHTFIILTSSSFYMNQPLKGNDCLQKRFDGIFILPDKVLYYELGTALFTAVTVLNNLYFWLIPFS